MGARKDVLIEGPCPDLFCGLCQDLLDEPIQVRCPEDHIFCKQCITNYIEQNDVCPFCQTTIDPSQFQPSKFVMRQIGRLPVYCVYRATGCSWQGLFYEDHSNQCEHQPADCPNRDQGMHAILT
ncbi:hypothetical protein CLU79DRAFT_290752 [Phycomyces nitens]|nr:hypothetical protein CLU79DRAFT_290752 [Phycomyces nitens]